MTIDFYYLPGSAPCRSVWLTAKAVGVELNLIETQLSKGEHMTPEYLKINPQHTIPTIKDGEFSLWESRAIMGYIANKYGKDDTLYPTEPVARARVDQKLYFDMGTLYQRFADYYYPQIFMKAPADPEKFKKIEEAFGFLNTALEGQKYAAGENITLADLALVASVSTFDVVEFPIANYANVQRWYEDCQKNVVGYEVNKQGMEAFKHLIEALK